MPGFSVDLTTLALTLCRSVNFENEQDSKNY